MIISTRAIRPLNPPDPCVADHLAIHLSEKHIPIGVAVDQMSVSAGNVFKSLGMFDLVCFSGSLNDRHHSRIVFFTAEMAKAQAGDSRSIGKHDFIFRMLIS